MTDENKILWECPTCSSQFGKHEIAGLINRLEIWLKNRPSPSMDCDSDLVERNIWLLSELKSLHKTYVRKPSRMMESQNAIGMTQGENNAANQGKTS